MENTSDYIITENVLEYNKGFNGKVVIPKEYEKIIDTILLNESFNHKINNLPKNLKKLSFYYSYKFNQSLNNLPQKLRILDIAVGDIFDKKINNLPQFLKVLNIPDSENNFAVNNLPQSLNVLFAGDHNNSKLNNLPDSLKVIVFGRAVKRELYILPKRLKEIYLYWDEDYGYSEFINFDSSKQQYDDIRFEEGFYNKYID